MGYQLQFAKLAVYDVGQPGISIPVTLRLGNRFAVLDAKLDTGATDCVFARKYAEQLDLKVEQGQHVRMGTATGSFIVWRQEITLEVLGYGFDVRVLFADNEHFDRNVLGGHGFLDQVWLIMMGKCI